MTYKVKVILDHHLNFCRSLDSQFRQEYNPHKFQLLLHKLWPDKNENVHFFSKAKIMYINVFQNILEWIDLMFLNKSK